MSKLGVKRALFLTLLNWYNPRVVCSISYPFLSYTCCSCFLVTYYFIHAMLPRLMHTKTKEGPDSDKGRDEIVVFMGEYGSYLKLDTCFAYAAVLQADSVVDILLSIAKYDPRHREVIKQTSKSVSMVFYEPVRSDRLKQLPC